MISVRCAVVRVQNAPRSPGGHPPTHTLTCCGRRLRLAAGRRSGVHVIGATTRRAVALGASGGLSIAAGIAAVGGVVAAVAVMAGSASAAAAADPRALTRQGMAKFRENRVEESVEDFDAAIAAAPSSRPYMWQRGLSLYYVGRYAEGSAQFREDVAVNPNDTEESIWAFLCDAQLEGPTAARSKFLQVGRDPRPVMRAAYECFRTGSPPSSILAAATDNGGHDTFYALLYVGLWHEAHGDAAAAQEAITAAVRTPYAKLSGDYMASLAVVHAKRRGWQTAA